MFALTLLAAQGACAIHLDPARVRGLASAPRWQALLHINHGATWRGVGESYADDPDFFLAGDGKRDALAELRATWRALRKPGSPARCRFPARYRFLAEHLHWQEKNPLSHCKKYQRWRAKMPLGQLALIFPAAYLNSPSSMFGHTLLRLDGKRHPDSVWLSRAINFGARTNGNENSIFYVWRGLAGGYQGHFSVATYAKKIRQYSFLENRDIWAYALNLDTDELDWLVRHLWELRDINFDYYFFDENCSFRLLELIKVARPTAALMQGFRFAQLPINTVRALYRAGLVSARRYRPSKQKQLRSLEARLYRDELRQAQRLARDPDFADDARFQAYAPRRRHLIAQVAYRALRLGHRVGERSEQVAHDSLALLRVVQANPAPRRQPMTAPAPPTQGHLTELAAITGGTQDGAGFGELAYRLTYHDILDPLAGFLPGAGIQGLGVRIRATDGQGLELENLDLVDIRSLAPRGPFVKPISWFVHTGLEQAPVADGRGLGFFLQGGPGLAWRFGHIVPYTFVLARTESVAGQNPDAAIGAGAQLGAVYLSNALQMGAKASMVYFAQHFYRLRTSMTADVPVSKNNAIRAECSRDTWRDEARYACRLAFRHFFN